MPGLKSSDDMGDGKEVPTLMSKWRPWKRRYRGAHHPCCTFKEVTGLTFKSIPGAPLAENGPRQGTDTFCRWWICGIGANREGCFNLRGV